jgi:hypothetical protein
MNRIIIGKHLPRNILIIHFHKMRGLYYIGGHISFCYHEPVRITIDLLFYEIVIVFFRENVFDYD